MKYLLLIWLIINMAWSQDLETIVVDHHQRLKDNPNRDLNFYEKIVARGLRKFGLNERLVNYLARHEHLIFKFKKASEQAQQFSKELCGVKNEEFFMAFTRNVDDEVDALRHLLWSGFLQAYMRGNHAIILTSLQEDRVGNNPKSLAMDVWNNYQAIEATSNLLRTANDINDNLLKNTMFKLLKTGKAKVIKNSKGQCSFNQYYPNL